METIAKLDEFEVWSESHPIIKLTGRKLFERSYGWLEFLDSASLLLSEQSYTARMDKSSMNFLAFHILQQGTYFKKYVLPFVEDF